jgi:hypothetical protein
MARKEFETKRISGDDTRTRSAVAAAGHLLTGIDADDVEYHYRGLVIRKDVYGEDVWTVCGGPDGEEYLDSINLQAVRTASELVQLLNTIVEGNGGEAVVGANGGSKEVEG